MEEWDSSLKGCSTQLWGKWAFILVFIWIYFIFVVIVIMYWFSWASLTKIWFKLCQLVKISTNHNFKVCMNAKLVEIIRHPKYWLNSIYSSDTLFSIYTHCLNCKCFLLGVLKVMCDHMNVCLCVLIECGLIIWGFIHLTNCSFWSCSFWSTRVREWVKLSEIHKIHTYLWYLSY